MQHSASTGTLGQRARGSQERDAEGVAAPAGDQIQASAWTEEERATYIVQLGLPDMHSQVLRFLVDALTTAPLPIPWLMRRDRHGRIFFSNEASKVTSWKHPLEPSVRELAKAGSACLGLRADFRPAKISELQEIWKVEASTEFNKWYAVKHEESGRNFYCHFETRESMWEHPAMVTLPAHYIKMRSIEKLLDESYVKNVLCHPSAAKLLQAGMTAAYNLRVSPRSTGRFSHHSTGSSHQSTGHFSPTGPSRRLSSFSQSWDQRRLQEVPASTSSFSQSWDQRRLQEVPTSTSSRPSVKPVVPLIRRAWEEISADDPRPIMDENLGFGRSRNPPWRKSRSRASKADDHYDEEAPREPENLHRVVFTPPLASPSEGAQQEPGLVAQRRQPSGACAEKSPGTDKEPSVDSAEELISAELRRDNTLDDMSVDELLRVAEEALGWELC